MAKHEWQVQSKTWLVIDSDVDVSFWHALKEDGFASSVCVSPDTSNPPSLRGHVVLRKPKRGWRASLGRRPTAVLIHPKAPNKFRICGKRPAPPNQAPSERIRAEEDAAPSDDEPPRSHDIMAIVQTECSICPQLLGKGAFGAVVPAVRKRDNAPAAIKLFHSGDGDAVDDALDELKYLRAVQGCPHVAKLFTAHVYFDPEPSTAMIVLQLADGNLYNILDRLPDHADAPRRVESAGVIAHQGVWHLFKAVAHVHACSMVHRDIKPGNVLWSRGSAPGPCSGKLMLADSGAATSVDKAKRDPATKVGTPIYRPPEIWLGGFAGPPTDVWAMGLVACQIVGWNWVQAPGTPPDDKWSTASVFGCKTSSENIVTDMVRLLGKVPEKYPEKTASKQLFGPGALS